MRPRVNSGIDWIEDFPDHWHLVALKRIAMLKSGDTISADRIDSDGTYPVYGGNGLRGYTDKFTHEGNYILIGRQGALCGNVNFASDRFWASEHAIVVTPTKEVEQTWLGNLLLAMNLNRYSMSAAQPGLSVETIKSLTIPLPPSAEQRAIANFLDRETAKIDALIAAQERLIALLDQKRQATITRAVTKGLDPTAPMQESGAEWLGKVPTGWQMKPLKHLFSISGGATPSKDEPAYWNGGIPWVSPKDMKISAISATEDTVSPYALSDGRLSLLQPGAILVVVRGMILAKRVPIAETSVPVTINQDMKALFLKVDGMVAYFRYLLSACEGIFGGLVEEAGHGTKTLRTDWLGHVLLPSPPVAEQEAIICHLDRQVERFDKLKLCFMHGTEHLCEHRIALITAAVTGQIDVTRPAITKAAE